MVRSFLIGLVLAGAGAAAAAVPGNPDAGRALAYRSCSGCHVVEAGQQRATNDAVPPFPAIAQDPATSEARLRTFLSERQHGHMPDFSLTRQEIDILVDYILGLRKPQ